MADDLILETQGLVKEFKGFVAVNGVDLKVRRGRIHALIGPNGAGKTTTLRILAGALGKTSGEASVCGFDVEKQSLEARRSIGYMPEAVPLYPEMRVAEYLSFRAELKGVARAARRRAVDLSMEKARVDDVANQRIGSLSKGYKQRVGLADALVADPPVLILDEPTSGLDPNQIRDVRDVVRALAGDHTVLLSTHILGEVEAVCDDVVVIHRGRLVAEGTREEIKRKGRPAAIEVVARGDEERCLGAARATVSLQDEQLGLGADVGLRGYEWKPDEDLSFFGLGTVTHVEGAKNCGFGHPMMEAGVTALPAAIGRVHWIFASDQHSSKIGESARPLGALVQDRQSAVIVDESKQAPTFPMTVEIKGVVGAPRNRWVTEVAEERFMSPSLVAAVLGSAVEATANERRDVTWRLKSKVSVQGHGTIELEDFGVATGGMPDAGDFGGARVTRAVGDVLNNPWEHPRIEKIESELFVEYARDVVRMRNVELLDPVVDAGGKARVRVHLWAQYGGESTRVIEITMPRELEGKDVDVEILPGYDATPDVASPESLSDLLANSTRTSPQPRGLVTQFKIAQGVVWRGHVAQRLPTFAIDTLRPQNSDKSPDGVITFSRSFVPFDKFVDGREKVRVKVRPIVR